MRPVYRWKGCKPRHLLVIIINLSLFAGVPSLFGGGNKDADLSAADNFIKEKQYDDAILVLSGYIKNKPENFGLAQRRLRRIVRLRGDYNSLAGILLDVLEADPENSEQILALIAELENMESPRNPNTREFIRRTRELAQFTMNRKRLENILVQGRALIDQGDYSGAMRAYSQGLDIYRDEFFASGYGDMVESRVAAGINDINDCVAALTAINAPIEASIASLERIGEGEEVSPSGMRGGYEQLRPNLETLVDLKGALITTGEYFDRQLAVLQEQNPSLGDRSFLSFASRLISGRSTGEVQEGMLGAVAGLWIHTSGRYEEVLSSVIDRAYDRAYASTLGKDYPRGRAEFALAAGYLDLPADNLKTWEDFRRLDGAPAENFFDEPVLREKAGYFLKYETMRRAITHIMDAETLGERFTALAPRFDTVMSSVGASQDQAAVRRSLSELQDNVETTLSAVDDEDRALQPYRDQVAGYVPDYLGNARSILRNLGADIASAESGAVARRYSVANAELERRLGLRRAELAEGNNLLEGTVKVSQGIEYAAKYPAEGLAVFTRTGEALASDLELGTVLITQYKGEEKRITESPLIQSLFTAAQATVNQLEELEARNRALREIARDRAAQAEAFRIDGERLFQQAQSALAQNNFEVARDRVMRAGERYDASLAIEDSASLRSDRDTRLVRLGAEINRLENELIIREVRELVINARTTYFAGNFEQAEEMLVRAQNRWRVTNTDNNAEVVYWLTIVRGALSIRSGRTIAPTAPLYPEISQLLSEAKKSYDEGVQLINMNRRSEGLGKFTEARQKTQEVKLMFPLNEDAGLLELRIDQVADPAAFTVSFQRRFSEAVAGTRRRSQEAFADLQNLAVINPRYPGMAAAINQAEIDMGIRPPPPDPGDLAQSNELTAAARAIINSNVRAQFPVALEQLNRALELNPNNGSAMTEKDRVQTMMGGGDSIVLDSAVEGEYQRAVRELQQGNTIVAMAIVQQLLQDPRNRTTRILDLQRRIESVL
jgi:tetratricopeptide (TPR) repeat protein